MHVFILRKYVEDFNLKRRRSFDKRTFCVRGLIMEEVLEHSAEREKYSCERQSDGKDTADTNICPTDGFESRSDGFGQRKSKPDIVAQANKDDGELRSPLSSENHKVDKQLRFGIETILKAKSSVVRNNKTDEEISRCNQTYENTLHDRKDRKQNSSNIAGSDVTAAAHRDVSNDAESDDEDFNENSLQLENNLNDTTNSYLSYFRVPSSFEDLRASDVTLMPSKPLLQSGSLTPPWSATLLNDLRKERYGQMRRIGHPYQNRTPPKRKKPRTSFTRAQILELEKRFERQKYLASTERSSLAKTLKMSDAQVKTWFQNRRTKWRRQTAEERELERQAANRLLLSLQPDPIHRKSMILSADRMCLSHIQRFQEKRSLDS